MSSPFNLPPVGGTSPGAPANEPRAPASESRALRDRHASPSPQNPPLDELPLRPAQASTQNASHQGLGGVGKMRLAAAPSREAIMSRYGRLNLKRRFTEAVMLSELEEQMIPEVSKAWGKLNRIYLGRIRDAGRPDEESPAWIEKARQAATKFVESLHKIFSQLRDAYTDEDKLKKILEGAKDAFLGDPDQAQTVYLADAENAEAKFALFSDTAFQLTDLKETMSEIHSASRPLLDRRLGLPREIPTSLLLEQINELESDKMLEQCHTLIRERHKHSQDAGDPYRPHDSTLRQQIIEVTSQAMELQLTLHRAAIQRIVIEEYADTMNALDACRCDPISTQEQSEAFLCELEPKLTEALNFQTRHLKSLNDYIAMLDNVAKAPGSSPDLKDTARVRSYTVRAARIRALNTFALTLTCTLSRSRIVDATENEENWPTSWQAEMRGRIHDLSCDVNACYQGTSKVSFFHAEEVPERIRPIVATLVAGKASSIIADLERIEGQLASSSRSRVMVQQLRPIIEQMDTCLIEDFAVAKSTLRKSIRGTKPHVREVIEDLTANALEYAAAHLQSFSARSYEESPDPSEELSKEGRSQAPSQQPGTRDEILRARQAEVLVQRTAQENEREFKGILRRLTSLEENVLAGFRELPTQADYLLGATRNDGKAPDQSSMSSDDLSGSLTRAHEDCKKAIAVLLGWIPMLAADEKFARTESASGQLQESIAAVQRKTNSLIADLGKRVPELSAAAFVQKPTWESVQDVLGDGGIEVEKTVDRHLTAHASGTDYLTEYVLYPGRPSQPPDLTGERVPKSSEPFCAVLHVHYKGEDAKEPSLCHLKTWAQRLVRQEDTESPVHYGDVPSDEASDFINDLEAALT